MERATFHASIHATIARREVLRRLSEMEQRLADTDLRIEDVRRLFAGAAHGRRQTGGLTRLLALCRGSFDNRMTRRREILDQLFD